MSLELLLIIICLFIIFESLYDKQIESHNNNVINYHLKKTLNVLNNVISVR